MFEIFSVAFPLSEYRRPGSRYSNLAAAPPLPLHYGWMVIGVSARSFKRIVTKDQVSSARTLTCNKYCSNLFGTFSFRGRLRRQVNRNPLCK